MRKSGVLLILLAVMGARPALADPVRVTSGVFLLDIEGDMFSLNGEGISLLTNALAIYSPKTPALCYPALPSSFESCVAGDGETLDWSFRTAGGEQLLGSGSAQVNGVNLSDVDFVGSLRFDVTATPLLSGGSNDVDFVAPFAFAALIHGLRDGQELFTREFVGSGTMGVNYEALSPGVFVMSDETIRFEFAATPTPEPGTLLLLTSGLAAAVVRRRREPRH